MTVPNADRFRAVIAEQPYPLLFVTISGAHLYGFSSADSDYDLRGTHVLPIRAVAGLSKPQDTIEYSGDRDGMELDLVTHDIKKFFLLMLKRNGYVLEQLYSPLVLHTTPEHDELKRIAHGCITRHHAHHYIGFAKNQWALFEKDEPRRIKPLLYVYRVLLTGIHLMQTGRVEANLVTLNDEFRLPQIDELVSAKLEGGERCTLEEANLTFHQDQYERLLDELKLAHQDSTLAETPDGREALDSMLVHLRMESMG